MAAFATLIFQPAFSADVALIIDDMGNTNEDISAFELPTQVAFSILPHKPLSRPFSARAKNENREVMIHIPMESLAGKKLGPGALTADMHPHLIQSTLQKALETVPHAIGMNNHMGSKLTQLTLPMKTTMGFLQQKQLFFVDSRTTRFSKAEKIAQTLGVPSIRRNVFLDHFAEPKHIDMQFKRLLKIARQHGRAVGIAHPYPQSVQYLKANLPLLEKQGIRLVPLTHILQLQELANINQQAELQPIEME